MRWRRFLNLILGIISIIVLSCWSNGQGASDARLTLDFTQVKVRDLLYLLAEYAHKSIAISDKIGGIIDLKLHDISWQEALDMVLQMQGLVKEETPNAIIITPLGANNKNGPPFIQPLALNLHHAPAESISKLLGSTGFLSPGGSAKADERTNILLVADTKAKIQALKELVKQIDAPAQQVVITAQIVSADENFGRELGLSFSVGPSKEASHPKINIPLARLGKFNFAVAKLSNNSLLDLELAALESEGRGKVISRPKLLTTDRQAAYIETGAEIPYQEKTKEGDTTVAFKKAVLSLKVTPAIVTANSINLLLQLNQDKVSNLTVNGVPAIDTRKIQTQVLVHNGETVVLGGIYEWGKSTRTIMVPLLGRLPLLGKLFQTQETKLERKELLIFVTPTIIP